MTPTGVVAVNHVVPNPAVVLRDQVVILIVYPVGPLRSARVAVRCGMAPPCRIRLGVASVRIDVYVGVRFTFGLVALPRLAVGDRDLGIRLIRLLVAFAILLGRGRVGWSGLVGVCGRNRDRRGQKHSQNDDGNEPRELRIHFYPPQGCYGFALLSIVQAGCYH